MKEFFYKYPTYWMVLSHLPKILILTWMMIGFTLKSSAQECVNQGFVTNQCGCPNADFTPVCGCDNKTYINTCFAFSCGAVTSYTNAPCEEMFIHSYPSLLTDGNKINFYIGVKQKQSATIIIYDVYGKVHSTRNIPYMDEYFPYKIEFEASQFPMNGLYFILTILPTGYLKVTKFLRYNI